MEEEQIAVAVTAAVQQPPAFVMDFAKLEHYYRTYFPYEQMCQWLSYQHNGDSSYFRRREFSLTLEGEIYLRYQMINSQAEFRNLLLSKIPEKIDIGAVFNKQGKKGDDIVAVEKEFVIDIDMTDYDEIRTCCSGAKICPKCWKFMRYACKVLSTNLREEFGFEHVLWVFSGRRGIHAWVCDQAMRKASDKIRGSVIDYLNILIDNSKSQNYVKSSLIKMNKNYRIEKNGLKAETNQNLTEAQNQRLQTEVEKDFVEIVLVEQDIFMKKPTLILEYLAKRSEDFSKVVEAEWKTINDSIKRYSALKDLVELRKKKEHLKMHYLLEELKIWLLYPRLDINVSKSTNHLLKSPFCIHPKTGNVCVPFTTKEIDTFNPFEVPSIQTLGSEKGDLAMRNSLLIFGKFIETLKTDV